MATSRSPRRVPLAQPPQGGTKTKRTKAKSTRRRVEPDEYEKDAHADD